MDSMSADLPDPSPALAVHPQVPVTDWDAATQSTVPTGAIRGGAAIAISKIAQQVLTLLITIVLARVLTPAEFGAVALITALLALGLVVQEAGLSSAMVQRERLSIEAVSTMFWANTALGLLLTVVFAALAPLIAHFFHQPELVTLCRVMSLTFVLTGVVAQHRAVLQRSMRFMTTAWIDIAAAVVGGICAIASALAGAGYWALVIQMLVTNALAMVLLIRAVRWRLSRPAWTPEVREMLRFGSSMLGFNVLVTAAVNLQAVLVGRSAGTTATGMYTRAYVLASVPQGLLHEAAAHVALPRLSRSQHDDEGFVAFYYRGVQLLTLVALPVAFAFAVFSDEIAYVVYGSQWGQVTDLLRVFSIGLAVAPLLHSTGPVFQARGVPQRMLRWGVFGSLVIIASVIVGLHWGTVGVAYGWSASSLLLVLPCLLYAYRDTTLSVFVLARKVGGAYAAAACVLPLGWVLRDQFGGLPALLRLVLGGGAMSLVYLVLCYFVFGQRAPIRDVIARLLGIRPDGHVTNPER